ISARQYLRTWRHEHPIDKNLPKIAVIDAQGDIVDGRGTATNIGGETYARLFDAAAHSSAVKAVVLRVNSPGGSASAAQRIGRAEARLKAAGKPFVVSMSTMAASGGYWISMDANRIYAEPTTITGSIGIFALVPNLTPLLTKLGIHSDGVGTTPLAGAFRMDAPLTDEQSALIQSRVDFGYAEFTQGVASGRHTTLSYVDRIAQGRVWSGAAAKQRGLVDAFGGLHAAVAAAASLAHLEPNHYSIENLSAVGGASQLIGHFLHPRLSIRAAVGAATGLPHAWSGPLVTAAEELKNFNDPHDAYAYCFCQLTPPSLPPG
ncbi:MAG TPA: S49 family peptidase, partial [Nevskiaceae bacterium]